MSVPQDYPDRPVAVIGAGTLGRRIALMFATRGGLVRINARRAEKGAAAVDFVEQQIGGLSGTHPGWWARGRAEYVARLEDAVAGGRGRDRPFGRPPAQIPACGTTALGSSLRSNAGSLQHEPTHAVQHA